MKDTIAKLSSLNGKRFYSFSTACLSLMDESNRINEFLKTKNVQVKELSDADFIIITTCAVSKDSAMNSVNNIKRIDAESGHKPIFVGGCLSNAKERGLLSGDNIHFFTADEIFGQISKIDHICEKTTKRCDPFWLSDMRLKEKRLAETLKKSNRLADLYAFTTDGIIFSKMPFGFDTIRISKGCNKRCSYCAIPHNRGKYIEHDFDYVKRQIDDSKNMHLLLIGENIGSHTCLENIIEYAISKDKLLMLRYLEPEFVFKIKPEYLKNIRYIGVPIQSASVKVLKSMRRPANLPLIKQRFNEWSKQGIFLGTSMILSYPTETIFDYLKSLWFVMVAPVHYISFQNFSPRENSIAFDQYKDWDSYTLPIKVKFWIFDRLVYLKGRWTYFKAYLGPTATFK